MQSYREQLAKSDPQIFELILGEEARQRSGIELIPSENYTDPEVMAALGSVFTNRYAEGYPGRRYYGGQTFSDALEEEARTRAKQLFRADHANVQALSGSPMNQAVYFAFLEPGDCVLAMDLSHGGHLTHGSPVSHMGRIFEFVRYKTCPEDAGRVDFAALERQARRCMPKIVLCGTTSSPRATDYAGFRRVADAVGAIAMADISHVGGLVAGGALDNPFDSGFDVVTTTTHKSLRGPRAGLILCKKKHAKRIDASVFPGLQGGPHLHTIAAAAVAFGKARTPAFRAYAQQVLCNAQELARALLESGVVLVSGGTDTHLIVIDSVASFGLDGRRAEQVLDEIAIATNKQLIPDDPNPPLRPSGIRIGTPAPTTRGMCEPDMRRLANWMVRALRSPGDAGQLAALRREVESFCKGFPVPGLSSP